MTWLVEILLICVFIVGAYYGYVSGFFKLAARPLRTFVSVIFAYMLCEDVADALFVPMLRSSVTNYVENFAESNSLDEVPTVIRLSGLLFGKGELVNSGASVAEIINGLALPFVMLLSSVISFVLLFLLAKIIFRTVVNAVDSMLSSGIIGRINRIMGVALTGAVSIALVWAIVGIADILFHSNLLAEKEFVREFQPGPIYSLMQEISLIKVLLSF